MIVNRKRILASLVTLWAAGCGNGGLFNTSFLNTLSGGIFPLTPGPRAAFVLIRVENNTNFAIEFVVTIKEMVLSRDEDGNPLVDEDQQFIFTSETQTVRLPTTAGQKGNDIGVLFPCRESIITEIGLGENLLPTDAAAFVGGEGAGEATGFGIPCAGLNPLRADRNNFDCGDTVVFQAVSSTGVAGGVSLQSFLLPNSEQPSRFQVDTFVTYEQFIESQVRENEP
ncbi:MAG: hypothetical protein AABZ47_01485 [Planctomycetota bacterium]